MTLDRLIELAEMALAERHSPWELETCEDWSEPSDHQYVRMGCDFIVEPSTHPLDKGEERMGYIAACDPANLLPLLRELRDTRSALGKEPAP